MPLRAPALDTSKFVELMTRGELPPPIDIVPVLVPVLIFVALLELAFKLTAPPVIVKPAVPVIRPVASIEVMFCRAPALVILVVLLVCRAPPVVLMLPLAVIVLAPAIEPVLVIPPLFKSKLPLVNVIPVIPLRAPLLIIKPFIVFTVVAPVIAPDKPSVVIPEKTPPFVIPPVLRFNPPLVNVMPVIALRFPELIINPLIVFPAVAPVMAPDKPRVEIFCNAPPLVNLTVPAVDRLPSLRLRLAAPAPELSRTRVVAEALFRSIV